MALLVLEAGIITYTTLIRINTYPVQVIIENIAALGNGRYKCNGFVMMPNSLYADCQESGIIY